MLNNQKIEEMRQMYELFCRVPEGIEIMIRHMSTYLRKRGEDLIKECMGNGNAQSANKDSGNTVPDISLATDDSEQQKPTTSSAITQNATSDKAISVISSTALSNPHHFIQVQSLIILLIHEFASNNNKVLRLISLCYFDDDDWNLSEIGYLLTTLT